MSIITRDIDWDDDEVHIIVSDYFKMLEDEIRNKKYNKTKHRISLLPLLRDRSEGSIEFKHQNISAILMNLKAPYIKGYKPLQNYQKLLENKVVDYINQHKAPLENQFKQFFCVGLIANFYILQSKCMLHKTIVGVYL